jgi:peptidoglycan/LPS O-acetylase OafA/YrhL
MRNPALDSIRGYAALVVLCDHTCLAVNSPLVVLFPGRFAVYTFFVLSGNVLTGLAQNSSLSFPAQVLRRYLRLTIPILLTSTFAWALLSLGAYANQSTPSKWLSRWYTFEPSSPTMLREALYTVFATGESAYNCNLWTMRPELFGSIFLFAINAACTSRVHRLVCYSAMSLGDYMLPFSIGAIAYEFRIPFPCPPFGQFLGRISFTTYLIQIPIICSLTAWGVVLGYPRLAGLVTIATVLALAALTYRWVDLWPTRLSRWAGETFDATTKELT